MKRTLNDNKKATPAYEWTCQKCGKANAAGFGACAHCGFPAHFTVTALTADAKSVEDGCHITKPQDMADFITFFPEAIIAIALMLYGPVLSFRMIAGDRTLAGLALLALESICVPGFVLAWRHAGKWAAYGVMYLFIVLFFCLR